MPIDDRIIKPPFGIFPFFFFFPSSITHCSCFGTHRFPFLRYTLIFTLVSIEPSSMTTVLFLLLLLLSSQLSWGFRFPYIGIGEQTGIADGQRLDDKPDTDLTTLLRSSPESQNHVYTTALQALEALRASPSCNRLAASALILSCQSIDASTSDPEGSLETLKSVYAAQLALCEITDAGANPPGTCEPFLPNNPVQLSRKLARNANYPEATPKALKGKLSFCLQSLESRPQHWTSYSNNRQNAVIMCQAARIDVEKDNLIKLHQSMINTTAGANGALVRALAAVNEALMSQKQFGAEVDQLQQQLMQDLQASKADTQSYLSSLVKNIDSALQKMIKQISDKIVRIGSEADEVETVLRSSAAEAIQIRTNVGQALQRVVEGSAELAAMQADHSEATSLATAQLRNSLQSMHEQEVQSLVSAFDSIHDQLRASNELVGVIYSRQNEVNDLLTKLDTSFASIESTATALQNTQRVDAEAQVRLQTQMQGELQVTQGLLADITASAVTLQATVQDAKSKIADMASYGGLPNVIMSWAWSLGILLVLYRFNPKVAGYAVTTLVSIALISIAGVPAIPERLLASAPSYDLIETMPLEWIYYGLFCSFVLLGLSILYRLSTRSHPVATSTLCRVLSSLPFGKPGGNESQRNCKV
ncbi:MAG: hypothetical protein L6R40_003688 [Gallowayella cf. fulva]|nr:MAG: hypothetical protein L6R40_003688 [Xanthomendoza cf. fulva]